MPGMRAFVATIAAAVVFGSTLARADHPKELLRSDPALRAAPATRPAPDFPSKYPEIQSLFFAALPYQDRPTTTFAYLGIPPHAAGEKLPAILLLHGGGGTAFDQWVHMWTARGYVAIAPDVCGAVPVRVAGSKSWQRHDPTSGPPGWDPFPEISRPIQDQWPYQALADAMLSVSLLRSLPDVDPERVGVTGISWGGYLTCMLPAVDERLKFAAPVYGCGFIDQCVWRPDLDKLPAGQKQLWLDCWDPRHYLPDVKVPLLWVDSTNDKAYPLDALQLSRRLPRGPGCFSVIPRMVHNHPVGQAPEILRTFADAVVSQGPPLPTIALEPADDGKTARATFTSPAEVAKVELLYTTDAGPWAERAWQSLPATVDPAARTASAPLPPKATACFFNLTDARGLTVSTEYREVP